MHRSGVRRGAVDRVMCFRFGGKRRLGANAIALRKFGAAGGRSGAAGLGHQLHLAAEPQWAAR